MRKAIAGLLCCAVMSAALAGCGSAASSAPSVRPAGRGPVVIRVPGNARTIQAAVSAAHPGDLVLVSPGVYHETVNIHTPNVVLRGTSRSGVVIDGQIMSANGIVVTAPGVAVENLTVRNETLNGILVTGMVNGDDEGIARGSDGYAQLDPAKFPPVNGFRVSYVTTSDNGLYGIYAFDAQHGLIDHDYASGSADSGIYVGQCKPCHITVQDNVAERNAVGYEGTNASGSIDVLDNRFVGNRVGATTDSDYQEAFVPQDGGVLAGNLIADNAVEQSPEQADGGFGIGVGIAGGTHDSVLRNRIVGNPAVGLIFGSTSDLAPIGNQVSGNVITDNGVDVVYAASTQAPGSGNCLSGNTIGSTMPDRLAAAMPCPAGNKSSAGVSAPLPQAPPGVPFNEVAPPPRQPDMPSATTAAADPAVGLPAPVDLAAIRVPSTDLLAGNAAVGG